MITRHRVPLSTPLAFVVWTALASALVVTALIGWASAAPTLAVAVFCVATLLLWATGLRAAALWVRSTVPTPRPHVHDEGADLRVALLYCVADDADLRAIATSMRQDRAVQTVILDDSREPSARERIDRFAETHGCRVVRREVRSGYKAGNLNHGISVLRGEFDAYVVCDSDVVLPAGLVSVCAEALADPTVAVAQASPDAAAGRTRFARYFGPLLATHLGVTRRGRAAHGVTAFLGRGALVRAAAIDDVGGFPIAVAEDLAMTVALRRRGWRLVDVDATFTEDYPIDYRAFRTQMRKTAEGAVEFLRRPGRLRGIPLRERVDILIETAMLPLGALAGVAALVSGAAVAAAGAIPPVWVLALSALCALMPLLPEAVRRGRTRRPAAGVAFAALGGALYTSTMFVVLAAVLRTLLGRRAVFWITPKSTARLGIRDRLDLFRPEFTVAPLLMLAAVLASGNPLSASAAAGPILVALAFSVPLLRPSPSRPPLLGHGASAPAQLARVAA